MSDLKHFLQHQKTILETLYLIRDIEEGIAERYPQGKMRCPTHLSIGQEGVPAALAPLLKITDLAVSTHRAHAHYLAKGGCPKAMLAEIYGKATGCSGGRGGSMHLIDESVGFKGSTAIVGNTIPIGVGLALAQKIRQETNISVVFVGDGAIEEGVFYEAANFAALKQLPVLFVCENNLYSVYAPLSKRQPVGRKITDVVNGIGINTAIADGNNVVECYQVLSEQIQQIREGRGPRFIEFSTYRWREHCGPNYDNHIGYRTEEEYLAWKAKEPIARFEQWLADYQLMSPTDMAKIRQQIRHKINAAFEFAEVSEFPSADKLANTIYG
ncbi:thiamine pyrophosphate-dependent dehydrogenase E1 component subunit alpha [Catenovulum sp. 2E275]|uniref:thiamine pyrophosphate-dependent dehydrogenase E1 component subunit alpha n=1 Tax=Catenovulum sp. 2E275 TaxID=2980497 RepID=UPI0021D2CA73|nr:thiamine pyrophosphate-dependent dehydrogenase E1 component subunit alpha [Catenovulum sp. 2E275]MCU4674733.1 thiamine pyrophosphate-dependent dehydrogenase E1 component subunit alpha [Catenovulum sp. 2E275]